MFYDCCKCGQEVSWSFVCAVYHDFKCWSLNTAIFNAYVRIFHADKYGLK